MSSCRPNPHRCVCHVCGRTPAVSGFAADHAAHCTWAMCQRAQVRVPLLDHGAARAHTTRLTPLVARCLTCGAATCSGPQRARRAPARGGTSAARAPPARALGRHARHSLRAPACSALAVWVWCACAAQRCGAAQASAADSCASHCNEGAGCCATPCHTCGATMIGGPIFFWRGSASLRGLCRCPTSRARGRSATGLRGTSSLRA
jgi:hypothetical protein